MYLKRLRILLEPALICAVFVLAMMFRWWLINLVPQRFLFDQEEYERYAAKIFWQPHFLASHSYRSYPFPLLMAFVYKFAGWANHQAIYNVNIILDSLVAVMVYIILKEGFKNRRLAFIGFLLYAFNPFTAGYVGVVLSEILATFFITATLLAGLFFVRKPAIIKGLLFGFLAGMAAETRNAAFIWVGVPIALSLVWVNWKKNIPAYFAIFLGLFITTIYPLYTNWRDYHEISITKIDSFYAMEFFNGASLKILPPFTTKYPVEQSQMWYEYYSEYYPGRTTEERKAMAAKYWQKGWDIVKEDPIDYIRWRFFKMGYVWQKENIFFYNEPGWEARRPLIYGGNLILLILAVIGIFSGWKMAKNPVGKWMWAALLGTILYGIAAFSVSHAEYRLSIPFYPVILALAAIGIITISNILLGSRKFK